MRQKLNVITLGVGDFERSMRFYRDGLGWKLSSASDDNFALFSMRGVAFALYPRDKLAEDATVPNNGNGFSGVTLGYNAKSQDEVDTVLGQVRGLGATIVKQAQKTFWGGYSGYFADPDGYLWEVAWAPGFEFDASDNLKLP